MSTKNLQENPPISPSISREQGTDDHASDLAGFSREQLAAMNRVLIALIHAASFPELLANVHRAMSDAACVIAFAHYVAMERGDLRLDCGAGEVSKYLPDIIPSGSDLLASIRSPDCVRPIAGTPLQPTLFGDAPVVSFWAIISNGVFAGAFACVHAVESEVFVNAVCAQIATSLHRLRDGSCLLLAERNMPDETSETEPVSGVLDRLTSREKELLALLCIGSSNKEIAAKLFISVATCKHHVESIFLKLGVHSRGAAVALELGLGERRSQHLKDQ